MQDQVRLPSVELPFAATLGEALRWRARAHGERRFLAGAGWALTYADAERRSAQIAKALLARGIGKGSRLAILFPNGADFALSFFAAVRIGALAAPINTFVKPQELGWLLAHGDATALLTAPAYRSNDYIARLEAAAPALAEATDSNLHVAQWPFLRAIYVSGGEPPRWARRYQDLEAGQEGWEALLQNAEDAVSPADWLCLIYTSGSTADPKGVVHSHGAMVRRAASIGAATGIGEGDVVFQPSPYFWIGGLAVGLLACLLNGATLLTDEPADDGETLALLERERVTIAHGWPHLAAAMRAHGSFPDRDLTSLRGGSLYDSLTASGRDAALVTTGIGMSETCAHHTLPLPDLLPNHLRGAMGAPAPGMELRIVDPETGVELAQGEIGELWVRGPSLMQTYYKREREDVFERDGYFRTGDLGAVREGLFFFAGRLGDMIKTAGANVSPAEVQTQLAKLPGVRQSFVMGLADPERGQLVAAAIVSAPEARDAAKIRSALKSELSTFKIPRLIAFLEPEEIPMLATGKLDKRALARLIQEKAGD